MNSAEIFSIGLFGTAIIIGVALLAIQLQFMPT